MRTKVIVMAVVVALTASALYAGETSTTTPANRSQKEQKRAEWMKDGERPVGALFQVALTAAKAREDTTLQGLVDTAIADRKAMITAESARVTAFEALVAAVRSNNEEQITAKREAFRLASEALRTAAEKVAADIEAIQKRLHELYPDLKPGKANREKGQGTDRPRFKPDAAPEIN